MVRLAAFGALLAHAALSHSVIFKPQSDFREISGLNVSFPVNLPFNNRAFGLSPNESNFDGDGSG